ncbi:MAG: MFS transporter [Candidatus Hodarchaeales archaeon]
MVTPNNTEFQPRMVANDPTKLRLGRTINISFAFLSVLIALTYYNFAVPLILKELIPENYVFIIFKRDFLIGSIMTIDNVLAVVLQPYFGALSDHTSSKYGRRMPYIIIGVLGCAFSFALAPWMKFLLGFVMVLFVFNILMSFYRTPALALLADYTPDAVRSKGSAIQQFVSNLGAVVAFLIPIVVGLLNLNEDWDRSLGFLIVAILMVIFLIILLLGVKETPTGKDFFKITSHPIEIDPVSLEIIRESDSIEKEARSKWNDFQSIFKEEDKSTLWILIAVFCWFSAFGALEAFFSLFGTEYFGLTKQMASTVILVYPISMIISAIPSGILGQRIGRKNSLYLGLFGVIIIGSIIAVVAAPLKDIFLFQILLFFLGAFWMDIIVNTFPMVWSLAPKDKVGAFTGIYYTFNQFAAIVAPPLMGFILDIGSIIGLGVNRYLLMFPFFIFCFVVAFLFLRLVKRGETGQVY